MLFSDLLLENACANANFTQAELFLIEEMFKEEHVIKFLERNILELTKTTVLLIIYIRINDVDTYYNVGVEIAIKK